MICTFYSFKGGVGRSMALANVADILAKQGLSVLMIDFDLEAPGLEQYFAVSHSTIRDHPGALDRQALDQVVKPTVLIVDELDKSFTLADPAEWRECFGLLLQIQARNPEVRKVIAALRSDLLSALFEFSEFAAKSCQLYSLPPIKEEDLRRAIERPAQLAGLTFEPGLVERIITDVGVGPACLQTAQIVLEELWNVRRDGWLTNEAYDRLGGVAVVTSFALERMLRDASPREQELTRRILRGLITVSGDIYLRRRAKLSDLLPAGQAPEHIQAQLEKLVAARLIVVDGTTGGVHIELAHESLLRNDKTLLGWLRRIKN
jgi:Novel STAND NTPase 1